MTLLPIYALAMDFHSNSSITLILKVKQKHSIMRAYLNNRVRYNACVWRHVKLCANMRHFGSREVDILFENYVGYYMAINQMQYGLLVFYSMWLERFVHTIAELIDGNIYLYIFFITELKLRCFAKKHFLRIATYVWSEIIFIIQFFIFYFPCFK